MSVKAHRMPCETGFSFSTVFPDLVNCLLRGMKGLGAHFILRGNVQPLFKKVCRVPYESTLRMSWTN